MSYVTTYEMTKEWVFIYENTWQQQQKNTKQNDSNNNNNNNKIIRDKML